jgi:hypothetical protein
MSMTGELSGLRFAFVAANEGMPERPGHQPQTG